MEKANLFQYATSELSQDAFICWLLALSKYRKIKRAKSVKMFVWKTYQIQSSLKQYLAQQRFHSPHLAFGISFLWSPNRHDKTPSSTGGREKILFIRTDPAGNIKADKEKSTEKIDGVIALIMALDRAIRCGNDISAFLYDERGILLLW